jgi:outer membrane protein assembly factor BamB
MAAVLAAASAGCARRGNSVAPPIAPSGTSAQSSPPASPTASASPQPIASLTGAAGRLLWSRPGLSIDRAVAVGDAVAVAEGLSPTPSAVPTPGTSAAMPFRLVALDADTGRVRATQRLGNGAAVGSIQLKEKTYRGKPVAASTAYSIEEAYDPAGKRVWRAPKNGLELYGDEGEYTLATTGPRTGGPTAHGGRLATLTGKEITGFGPGERNEGQLLFVHDDTAVVALEREVRVTTIAARPRTLWSSTRVAPTGLTAAEAIAVVDGRLLLQWTDADDHRRLTLHDLEKGTTAWRAASLPGGVTQGAVVLDADTHIAVIGSDGTGPTLGIDVRTGKISWRLSGQQNFRPVAASKGRVYGASGDSAVALDARTGKAVTLGTHVDVAGVAADGVVVLQGATSPTAGRVWAFRPT